MSEVLISVKTRQAFREYMVGWGLRQIADEFDAARIACDLDYSPPVRGERRRLVEQYYITVDWEVRQHVAAVLQVFEAVLRKAEQSATEPIAPWQQEWQKKAQRELENLIWHLQRDGFEWAGERIRAIAGSPALVEVKAKAKAFDANHMADQIRRMENALDTDPALAIGTAKELIETCCKTILAERGKPVTGTPDIAHLTKDTLKELKLVPEGVRDAARGAEVVKRILRSLGTIGNDLAELRGLYGTGHGQHGRTTGLRPRHAKLAVGAAATFATFLLDTHLETKS